MQINAYGTDDRLWSTNFLLLFIISAFVGVSHTHPVWIFPKRYTMLLCAINS